MQAHPEPLQVTPVQLITGSRTIQGWASGTTADEDDTLRFAELSGVRPMIETYPLEKAAEGYARMATLVLPLGGSFLLRVNPSSSTPMI